MNVIEKFGELKVTKGESDDPRDIWIDLIGFEFSTENTWTEKETIFAVLDYIKEQLS